MVLLRNKTINTYHVKVPSWYSCVDLCDTVGALAFGGIERRTVLTSTCSLVSYIGGLMASSLAFPRRNLLRLQRQSIITLRATISLLLSLPYDNFSTNAGLHTTHISESFLSFHESSSLYIQTHGLEDSYSRPCKNIPFITSYMYSTRTNYVYGFLTLPSIPFGHVRRQMTIVWRSPLL